MPEVSKESAPEVIAKERKFGSSQSETEHETAPRDRRADVAEDGGGHTSAVSGTWPYPPEVASKLEKLKRVRRISMGKEPRILDRGAEFSDFPWAPPNLSRCSWFGASCIRYIDGDSLPCSTRTLEPCATSV